MNMLPSTNAPRLPNIGLTSTPGAFGTRAVKRSRSASVGLSSSSFGSFGDGAIDGVGQARQEVGPAGLVLLGMGGGKAAVAQREDRVAVGPG